MHLKHITNTTLLLSSMDLFPQVNLAYGQHFGTSPPSRACVAVDLPPLTRVRVACVAFRDEEPGPNQRSGLHVQGVSYWAPANIGPYSQAIIVSLFSAPCFIQIFNRSMSRGKIKYSCLVRLDSYQRAWLYLHHLRLLLRRRSRFNI
jgi:hypothetical protein